MSNATRPGDQSLLRPRAALFDIDGTLALHRDRSPYDWRNAGLDEPNMAAVQVLRALDRDDVAVIYITGRPESARTLTELWLAANVGVPGPLFHRPDNDQRKDAIVKRELFEREIMPSFEVIVVFDDRDQVVRMWRDELGLRCFQVAPGDF